MPRKSRSRARRASRARRSPVRRRVRSRSRASVVRRRPSRNRSRPVRRSPPPRRDNESRAAMLRRFAAEKRYAKAHPSYIGGAPTSGELARVTPAMIQSIRDSVHQAFYEDPDERFGVDAIADIVDEGGPGNIPIAVIQQIVAEEFRKHGRRVRRG